MPDVLIDAFIGNFGICFWELIVWELMPVPRPCEVAAVMTTLLGGFSAEVYCTGAAVCRCCLLFCARLLCVTLYWLCCWAFDCCV